MTYCLFRRRHSANGTVVRKISMINKELFHLIDDIFWNLGFKNETQAEKVINIIHITHIMHIISLISNISIILIISIIWQVHINLGIPDHVWQEKRSVIEATIDGLDAKFKPELRAAWLAYIS